MTNYKLSSLLCAILCMVLLGVGCTTEVDYSQGSEFVPSNQKMELKRRTYKGGVMREGEREESLAMAATRNILTDSLRSSNLDYAYLGTELSDTFGERSAGFMTQMLFSMSLHKDRGWGYRPIFDSMCLGLYVSDYHGDTTIKQRFEVYEITSNDYINLGLNRDGENDTTFYINFDPTPYIGAEPIFEFTFPNQEKGVYVGDIEEPKICPVRLENTSATMDYIRRLMFLNDLEANDGFAYDKDSLYVNGNEERFVNEVKGLYIKPKGDVEGRGAVYSTKLSESAMYLYARGRYKEDPTIIQDTTYMLYNFYLDPSTYDVKAGNVSVSMVEHDMSNVVTLAEGINLVDGMGGYVTEVEFTDEMIQSLADVALANEGSVVSVNQAHLKVYLDGSDYDPEFIAPLEIAPKLNSAMQGVGLYTDYSNGIGIVDYIIGSSSSTFDGVLNRSLACYNMDISTFVQSLMFAAADNLMEDGKTVDFAKFKEGYEPKEECLVDYRRLYIGPDAAALFGFNRQAIYGGDAEGAAKAPISLELTYTIVD